MIRTLRNRHRTTFALLSVALPLLVAAGLMVRRPIPRMTEPPPERRSARAGSMPVREPLLKTWDGGSLRVTLVGGATPGRYAVRLEPLQDLKRPELLVYWSPRLSKSSDTLPAEAQLLGALAGRHAVVPALPEAVSEVIGHLILFSPTQQEIVTTVNLSAALGSEEPP